MASKAWYRPGAVPRRVSRFASPSRTRRGVEVWWTTCLVTNFGRKGGGDGEGEKETARAGRALLPDCSTLVNPANPYLTGPSSFPYFARGGPQPAAPPTRHAHHIMGYVSRWGGMDVGRGMMFAAETVDGLVHLHGGAGMQAECAAVREHSAAELYDDQQSSGGEGDARVAGTVKCPVGQAVMTRPGGRALAEHWDAIVHTVPPFYDRPPSRTRRLAELLECARSPDGADDAHRWWSRRLLRSCYERAFDRAFRGDDDGGDDDGSLARRLLRALGRGGGAARPANGRVATPLLGAGCRGFPRDAALEVAAECGAAWLRAGPADNGSEGEEEGGEETVAFGLLEEKDAEELSSRIGELLRDEHSDNDSAGSTEDEWLGSVLHRPIKQ